ncbi:MAG: phospholipase D-like domain-containing protein [Planctomycetota bacterium]
MRKARLATYSVTALAAAIVVVCFSRAETAPAPNAAVYFAPTGEERRVHQALEDLLESAKREVVIAVYQFTSPELGKLVNKTAKRVKVRILLDEDQTQGRYSQHEYLQGKDGPELKYVRLPGSGAEREKFHHKFCVVDGETVATGSYNWTVLADEKNYENLLILRDPRIAQEYLAEFDRVWNDANVSITK